jgi:prophage regulatory protein
MGSASHRPAEPIRILRLAQVIEATGLGKTKLYELQASGDFPMRVQITNHSVGWVAEEVQAWLLLRLEARTQSKLLPPVLRAQR